MLYIIYAHTPMYLIIMYFNNLDYVLIFLIMYYSMDILPAVLGSISFGFPTGTISPDHLGLDHAEAAGVCPSDPLSIDGRCCNSRISASGRR